MNRLVSGAVLGSAGIAAVLDLLGPVPTPPPCTRSGYSLPTGDHVATVRRMGGATPSHLVDDGIVTGNESGNSWQFDHDAADTVTASMTDGGHCDAGLSVAPTATAARYALAMAVLDRATTAAA